MRNFGLRYFARVTPQFEHFALPIPTCWYLKLLAYPTRTPSLSGGMRAMQWKLGIGHANLMLYVSFSLEYGQNTKLQDAVT